MNPHDTTNCESRSPDERVSILAVLISSAFRDFEAVTNAEEDMSFDQWYGNWPAVFVIAAAARLVRKGSRTVAEKQFQTALFHQRAMYLKSSSRGEVNIEERRETHV